jgi:hypothetical protein
LLLAQCVVLVAVKKVEELDGGNVACLWWKWAYKDWETRSLLTVTNFGTTTMVIEPRRSQSH